MGFSPTGLLQIGSFFPLHAFMHDSKLLVLLVDFRRLVVDGRTVVVGFMCMLVIEPCGALTRTVNTGLELTSPAGCGTGGKIGLTVVGIGNAVGLAPGNCSGKTNEPGGQAAGDILLVLVSIGCGLPDWKAGADEFISICCGFSGWNVGKVP